MKYGIIALAAAVCFSAHGAKKQPPAPNRSVIVINQSTNQITHEYNADLPRSMASITKVMTAMVVLDTLPNLYDRIKLKVAYLGKREYTVKEMLDLLLVRSDNNIAEILSKNFLAGRDNFIKAMNVKAQQIGMTTAKFVDPSGIGAGNRATAKDIARMVLISASYPAIRDSSQPIIELETGDKKGYRTVSLHNTNYRILNEFNNVIVSKTGTTSAAGKCVAMVVEQKGQTYAVVVLGEPNGARRDTEARNLIYNYLD